MNNAILWGPFIGELGWEILRFSALVPYKREELQYSKEIIHIVMTREERFDLYGLNSDILVPLRIQNDNNLKPNCFKLEGFSAKDYQNLIFKFKEKYKKRFNILGHIYPEIDKKQFCNKVQFPNKYMLFDWKPRYSNKELIDNLIPNDKPLITIAPRFRNGLKRNWPYWTLLYNKIKNSDLLKKYNFVICGKDPDYVKETDNKFYDINNLKFGNEASVIGLTIECIKRSILTVGSQSGIPIMSLLLKTPVLEWGNQKDLHTRTYNFKKTQVYFLDDMNFSLDYRVIFNKMSEILLGKI